MSMFRCPKRPEASDLLELELRRVVNHTVWCWEMHCVQQEQYTLLTTEPPLLPVCLKE